MYSPIKAPINGPKIIPIGKNKRPKINPIILPIILPFPPPLFFTPIIEIILSKTKIVIAIKKVITKNLSVIEKSPNKYKIKNPIQLKIGPGRIGKKLPIIPSRIKIKLTIITIISKLFYNRFFRLVI